MTRSVALALALLVLPAPALADGGPVLGMDAGPAGVTARGSDRFVAMHSLRGTTIARIERDGGRVVVARYFPRAMVIPVAAYDGTATGLSADGGTLVTATQRRGRTDFTVLETKRLKRRSTFSLRGQFTLDALNQDGSLLYLIETRRERYVVRGYHVGARELLPGPIVDPSEPEPMQGNPLTRAMSRDGRWAYTFYEGPEHPFIHALDTQEATARCIDLDALAGRSDLLAIRLRVGPDGAIRVHHAEKGGEPLLVVDPKSFAVREPGRPPAPEGRGGGWLIIVAGLGLLALVSRIASRARAARRRPPRPAPAASRDPR